MIFTLFRRLLIVIAAPVEILSAITTGRETGFGDWCMDRKPGDPTGRLLQTREQARGEARRRSK